MTHDAERWSPSDELLDRFLAERTAPDERVAIEAWLARTPAGWRAVDALRQVRFSAVESHAEQEELWQRIERRCRGVIEPKPLGRWRREEAVQSGASKRQPLRNGAFYTVTGIVLGVIAMSVGWSVGASRLGRHGQSPTSTYTTGNGQRANIALPDGNTVALDVASRLEVPADYLTGNHTLSVTGEALFTVTHHGSVPFMVTAGSVTTRVLGTSFVVRHFATDTATLVAVRDGKVAVGATVLGAAQQAEVGRRGMPHVQVASPAQFTFATGVLTLDDMLLPTAIVELDRWYDADIRLGGAALASHHVKGEFAAGSLADLSAILELTFDVRIVRDGRVLTLYPNL